MQVVKPPAEVPDIGFELGDPIHLFLGGSIEMGAASLWQDEFTKLLGTRKVLVLNPRRDDWDSSWEQDKDNPEFLGQVTWELDGIENADVVVFYFDPNTKSPITLMELGIVAGMRRGGVAVICPEGFWRKGNVDIVCERFGIEQYRDFEELIFCLDVEWSIAGTL